MGIGNAIKAQEQTAQPSEGADIVGLLKNVQESLDESRQATAADREAMQKTLDDVSTTVGKVVRVQNTLTQSTSEITTLLENSKIDFQEGLDGVRDQVRQVKVSQETFAEARTLQKSVNEIMRGFREDTQQAVEDAGDELEERLEKVQAKFRSPAQWFGSVDHKETFKTASWLYVLALLAVIATIATVVLLIFGTRQLWHWATTTAWFGPAAAIVLLVPALLGVWEVSKLLWDKIRGY